MLNEIIKMIELSKNTKGQDWRHNIKQIKIKINEYAKEYHESNVKKLNIPLPTVLSLEEILKDAVRRKATYSVQYADYDLNTWTAPVELTQNRMDKLLDDGSIRKVRLELEM